ncbi:hypothetical protein CNMCM5623_005133 [Aspergillus felis]|uniref:Uncharacterized protein n=1 Tax=Aspergillus felis TaxID=1287682 RepID=A0A8H6V2K4_9EURO|nr:hypothetical protein CNMCM5623_005133 [Aspergillus felis]
MPPLKDSPELVVAAPGVLWSIPGCRPLWALKSVLDMGGFQKGHQGRTCLHRGYPLLLAAWYSPVIPSGLASALAVRKLLGRVSAAWVMVIGMVAYLIGSILIATMPAHQIYWGNFFWSVLIICVGMDSSFPAATIIFSMLCRLSTRGAFYFELGLAGLGLLLSLVFLVKDHFSKKAKKGAHALDAVKLAVG